MPFTTKLLNIKQNLDQHFINLDKKINDLLHEYIITDEENENEDEIDTKEAHPLLSRIFEILLLRGIFSILATTIINIITAPFYAAWCVYNLVSLPLRLIDLTLDDVKGYLSSPIKAILTLAFVSIMPAIIYFYHWSAPLYTSVCSLISDTSSLPGLVALGVGKGSYSAFQAGKKIFSDAFIHTPERDQAEYSKSDQEYSKQTPPQSHG